MSGRNIYPSACHSLNEEAVMAEQGRQGVRKSNTNRQRSWAGAAEKEGAHGHGTFFVGQLLLGKDDGRISVPMTRVFFQVCWDWQSRNRT